MIFKISSKKSFGLVASERFSGFTILRRNSGFTIVELLVVIVVIGILAAITIVSYTGISGRANVAVIKSDLSNASKKLKIYQATNDSYPTALDPTTKCPSLPTPDTALCLKASANNTFTYTSNGTTFNLVETSPNGLVYNVTDNTAIAAFDPWIANWYSGVTSTALAGKHVYKTDLSATYQYKISLDAVVSPQGAIGLDPSYPSNMALVSPQANPTVDFSAYPAQDACKAIGGRVPNMQELLAIYAGIAVYGNNFNTGAYWSSTELSYDIAYYSVFYDGRTVTNYKTGLKSVRCISG